MLDYIGNKMSEVRVRFAPSPTGYLHVGGLRTALYNYLFAKHNNGKLILRIEDTDRTRLVEDSAKKLVESMRWAGIEFDESPEKGGDYGPYVQSERFDLYKKYGKELIEKGKAYYAFDTGEELDAMRQRQQAAGIAPKYDRSTMRNQYTLGEDETKRLLEAGRKYCVRLYVPQNEEIKFKDLIRGEVTVIGKDVDDQILLKSDGFPTYHLANVVDDHLMKISHIIRGDEWLPSTPKHVLLYKAFGWDVPIFAHLPLLLNQNKQKLSKRHGDVAVEDFRDKGFIRDAFVNFIAILGYNPSGEKEIYSIDELIESFDLSKCNKAGAVFDTKKLEWMNTQYLKATPTAELVKEVLPEIRERFGADISEEYVGKVTDLVKERIHFLKDLPGFTDYMFLDDIEYDEGYVKKRWKDDSRKIAEDLLAKFEAEEDFTHHTLYNIAKEYVEENNLKLGPITHPLRIMLTGKPVGAGIFETMEILGKENSIKRMKDYLEK